MPNRPSLPSLPYWRGRDGSRARTARPDTGATLILALIFLVTVSLTITAVANWTGSSLNNTAKFTSAQSFQTTANSADQVAIQYVRYNFIAATLNASPPVPCWTTAPTVSSVLLNNQTVDAWCSTYWMPGTQSSRLVTVSLCLSTVTQAACESAPLVQTIVKISDFKQTTGVSTCLPVASPVISTSTTCGTSLTVMSWVFGATVPTVTGFLAPVISCAKGTPVRISGSGFTQVTNVYFVSSQGSGASQAFAATQVSVVNSSTIDACTPPGTAGLGASHVVVLTASGPTPIGSGSAYTL